MLDLFRRIEIARDSSDRGVSPELTLNSRLETGAHVGYDGPVHRGFEMPNSILQYTINLYPSGPLGSVLFSLAEALETARELETAGHVVQSIRNGKLVLKERDLRAALDGAEPGLYAWSTRF